MIEALAATAPATLAAYVLFGVYWLGRIDENTHITAPTLEREHPIGTTLTALYLAATWPRYYLRDRPAQHRLATITPHTTPTAAGDGVTPEEEARAQALLEEDQIRDALVIIWPADNHTLISAHRVSPNAFIYATEHDGLTYMDLSEAEQRHATDEIVISAARAPDPDGRRYPPLA